MMLVVCGTGIALGAQSPSESTNTPNGELSQPPQQVFGTELEEKRTATSDTFLLPDGSLEARLFDSPVNYRDAQGDWMPIGEGLKELPGGGLTNGPNSFDVHLPESLGDGPSRISTGEGWVSAELAGQQTEEAQLTDGLAIYESTSGETTFALSTLPNGVKEDIEIANPSQPSSFDFELEASSGLTPSIAADGSIKFRNTEDQVVVVLPAPTIADSAPGAPLNSQAVQYRLAAQSQDQWQLTVEVDRVWLEQPDRVWPVRIDPSLTVPSPSLDCTFGSLPAPEGWHGCGVTGQQELQATYNQQENQPSRSLVRFNTGAVPKNSYVTAATLSLYAPVAAENTAAVQLRRATRSWTEKANWLNYDVPTDGGIPKPWTTPGGDYTAEGADILTSERGSQAGWWNFASAGLTEVVRGWVSGEVANQGALITNSNESKAECEANPENCGKRYVAFSSSAVTNPLRRPRLAITYNPPAPSTSQVTSPTEGTQTARRLKLKAAWSVQGVTGVIFQFRRKGDNSIAFHSIPSNLIRNAKGESVSWPLAVQGKQSEALYFDAAHSDPILESQGGDVEVRALFLGSLGATGYSAAVKATVNRFIGGTRDATASVGPGTVNLMTGNYSISRTDVSIPAFGASLEFGRTNNSRGVGTGHSTEEQTGILGAGWKPTVTVEAAGGAAWRKIHNFIPSAEEKEEGLGEYAILTDLESYEYAFEKSGESYVSPPGGESWVLAHPTTTTFTLTDAAGNRTVFEKEASGEDYVPVSVSRLGGSGNSTRMVYQLVSGKKRLTKVIAPTPAGLTCEDLSATTTLGCRVLTFTYQSATTWGAPSSLGERLAKITYYGPSNSSQMGNWEVANYSYNTEGKLIQEWDPRISPALKETYAYKSAGTIGGQLASLTPPGEEPWSFDYYESYDGELSNGRLLDVKRASLLASPTTAQTTIVYGAPIAGSGAPYDMSGAAVTQWGQQDLPTDATAVFPPDQIPGSPPSSYSRATLYYMDAEGQLVNTATPSGAGTSAPSITTAEPDEHGNVVRELSAQNRLRALAQGSESEKIAKSHELETKRNYDADGTEMQEEWGPMHQVRLASGESKQARMHRTVEYDAEAPTPPAGTPKPHLPTRETTGASIPGQGADADQQITETKYKWALRKPTDVIVDPLGLALRTHIEYDETSGLPTERRLPGNPNGGDAHSTKIVYYTKGSNPFDSSCGNNAAWANLPCKVGPAAQVDGSLPQLLVTKYSSYSPLSQPTNVIESPGGGGEVGVRSTAITYDTAGRKTTREVAGSGTAIPGTEILYSSTTGRPLVQRFKQQCAEGSCTPTDVQALTTTYDKLGRPSTYEDADGNVSSITYDLLGRPVTTSDGKGIQTSTYDPTSGLLIKLEDSGAGTFTAAYDADGNMVEEGLPDGLLATTTYDETGQPTHLAYEKKTFCSLSCTWLDFGAERSIYGQVLNQTSLASTQQYSYDKAGRLTQVKDTPQGGGCTTRSYSFDADSNRTKLITRAPGVGGACDLASQGTPQSYSYDAADRLTGTGITYDNYERITSLPAAYAGGSTLTSTYYVNDLTRSQSQNGITNTYELDGAMRQRTRVRTGGSEAGTEVYHYAGGSDSPTWIDRGSSWSRSMVGIGGGITAIQDSVKGTTLQLTNLHGDIVATASTNPEATKLLASFEFDEFGNPKQGSAGKYGWLGGKGRRTEFPSGIVQMGVRSYVPAMGRFISTDPVQDGSATAYDYATADPINGLDLDGMRAKHKTSHGVSRTARAGGGVAIRARSVLKKNPAARTVTVPGPTCDFSSVGEGKTGPNPYGYEYQVSVAVSWACTKKTTVYGWMKGGGEISEPEELGNSRTGSGELWLNSSQYMPHPTVCLKFFYAGESVKSCKKIGAG
jgi:RHS repeat-associated protein